jgi:hypothetical protein
MQVVDRETIEDQEHLTTEGTEITEKRAPVLSEEQREWLNTVFIPNFRAELMRTLRPEDLVPSGGRRNSRHRKGKPRREADGVDKGSPTPSGEGEGAASEGPSDGAGSANPDSAERSANDQDVARAETDREAEQAAQRVGELEGENRRLRAALAETRVDRELVWAAASQHAINPAQVAHLLSDRVQLDRNLDPIVVNANGDRAYDRYGRPVTVADAVRTFLEENPHLVRPSTQLAGGGSGGTDATARTRRVAAVTGGDLIEEALREGE